MASYGLVKVSITRRTRSIRPPAVAHPKISPRCRPRASSYGSHPWSFFRPRFGRSPFSGVVVAKPLRPLLVCVSRRIERHFVVSAPFFFQYQVRCSTVHRTVVLKTNKRSSGNPRPSAAICLSVQPLEGPRTVSRASPRREATLPQPRVI